MANLNLLSVKCSDGPTHTAADGPAHETPKSSTHWPAHETPKSAADGSAQW